MANRMGVTIRFNVEEQKLVNVAAMLLRQKDLKVLIKMLALAKAQDVYKEALAKAQEKAMEDSKNGGSESVSDDVKADTQAIEQTSSDSGKPEVTP